MSKKANGISDPAIIITELRMFIDKIILNIFNKFRECYCVIPRSYHLSTGIHGE